MYIMILIFRGANIKLQQVVTKTLENTKELSSMGKIPAGS